MCELNIKNIINTVLADDDEKGDAVYREIVNHKDMGADKITLDFKDIELVNTAFLNNAIGKLYNPDNFDFSKVHVVITNMNENMLDLLYESIKTARMMYS